MEHRMKLQYRLLRATTIQITAIILATLLGVLITAAVMEHVLLRLALEQEADFFWEQRLRDPDHNLPHTLNMRGYFETNIENHTVAEPMPDAFIALASGFHQFDFGSYTRLVHVSQRHSQRLYLVINEAQIAELSFLFGVLPLMFSFGGLYLLAWLTQRLLSREFSPIAKLSRHLETLDPSDPQALEVPESVAMGDSETLMLYEGVEAMLKRVRESVDREKRFSRDASHELRTPLAVMRGSIEIITKDLDKLRQQLEHDADPMLSRTIDRIVRSNSRAYRAAIEMGRLISELLLLAREDYARVTAELINSNELIEEIASEVRAAFPHSPVRLIVAHQGAWNTIAPLSALRVVLTNIITNAMRYTQEGQVTVSTDDGIFKVTDTGIGFDPTLLNLAFQPFSRGHHEDVDGFGLGLSIVKRFCSHYNWKLNVKSAPGQGSEFTISLRQQRID